MLTRRQWCPIALLSVTILFPRSARAQDECNGGIAAAVQPDGMADTVSAHTTNNSVVFTVYNNGPCTDFTYLSAGGGGTVSTVTIAGANPLWLGPWSSANVTVHFDIGGSPGGGVSLTASGYVQDQGSYDVTAGEFTVAVTPVNQAISVTGGVPDTATFVVTNTGTWSDTYYLSCASSGSDTCGAVSPGQVTLAPTATAFVTVSYTPGGEKTSTLSLTAASASASNAGSYVLTRAISLVDYNQGYRDVARCVANCFDAVASYTTDPHYSQNITHPPASLQLVYRSSLAHPMPVVQFNAWDTTDTNPTMMSVKLQSGVATFETFANNSQEMFFACPANSCQSTSNRFAVQLKYDSTRGTGAYSRTLIVRSHRPGGSVVESTTPIVILVENEEDSPFGAGWTLAGVQRVYDDGLGGVLIAEAGGALAYFPPVCSLTCVPGSAVGDFTKVTKHDSVGADGVAVERRYPDGTIYKFYADGRPAYVQDRFGNKVTIYTYDASTLLVGIGDTVESYLDGGVRHYLDYYALSYDVDEKLSEISSSVAPGSFAFINSTTGNLDSIIGNGSGVPFRGTYDSSHHLTHWTDRRGGAWGIRYDFAGMIKADTAPSISGVASCSAQGARCPVTQYASLESVELVDPGSGLGSSLNPAPARSADTLRARITNPRGHTTAYALGRYGQATRVEEPLGRTTRFTYDPAGHHTMDSLPSGHVTRYVWDKAGNLKQVRDSNGVTPRIMNYAYDSTYNLLTQVSGDVDSVTYWLNGSAHDGHPAYSIVDSMRYAGRTEVMVSTEWDLYGPTPGCLKTLPMRFHQCNHRGPQKYRPNDGAEYPTQGLVNDSAVVTNYWQEFIHGNTAPSAKVSFIYDSLGRPITTIRRVSDALSDTTWKVYDARGRDSIVTDALHGTTKYFYDALYLTQVQDAKGQVYTVWPNALGWPDSTSDPTGAQTKFHYDLNGNLDTVTNRRGQLITRQFDALDHMTLLVAGTDTTWFTTDPHDLLQTARNKESTDTIRFDVAGRKIAEVTCRATVGCFEDSSEYNNRDLRTKLRVSSASSLWAPHTASYYYHAAVARLDSMVNFTNERMWFGYAPVTGRDSTRTLPLGNLIQSFAHTPWIEGVAASSFNDAFLNRAVGSAYRYDEAQRLIQSLNGGTARPDTNRWAMLDRNGRLVGHIDQTFTWDPSGSDPCIVRWFGLNPDNPLTRLGETCDYQRLIPPGQAPTLNTSTYKYDAVGNRIDSLTQNYVTADSANRLLRWKNFRMAYDADGNELLKRRLQPDTMQVLQTDSLWWSPLGRLDSLRYTSGGNTTRVTFGYDAWGRQVRRGLNASAPTRYLYDGDQVIFTLDGAGARQIYYTWYPGTHEVQSAGRVYASGPDTTLYYVTDASHNVVARLKSHNGSYFLYTQMHYGPFGDSLRYSGPGLVYVAAPGYKTALQQSSSLYLMGTRYYDPDLGRFISEDPIGLKGGINLYAFAGNDPVNGWDPSGEKPWPWRTFSTCVDFAGGTCSFGDYLPSWAQVISSFFQALQQGWKDLSLMSQFTPMPIGMVGPKAYLPFTARNFRRNLLVGGLRDLGKGAHAHHALPKQFSQAFGRAGINIHDPKFGAWWESASHSKNASAFNAEWGRFLGGAERTQSEIFEFGRRINERYGIPVTF